MTRLPRPRVSLTPGYLLVLVLAVVVLWITIGFAAYGALCFFGRISP